MRNDQMTRGIPFLVVAIAIAALTGVGCTAGMESLGDGSGSGSGGGGGGGAGGSGTATLTSPGLAAIRTALGTNNAFGMVPGQALGAITLPAATAQNVTTVTYSMTWLPAWLSFNATTRAVTLTTGATVPNDAAAAAVSVTYTAGDASGAATSVSETFSINDMDGGGVLDSDEYDHAYAPLLNASQGFLRLDGTTRELYSPSGRIPTAIAVRPDGGMDPTDAADDTADFDGDGTSNATEISNGTDPFVFTGIGTFTYVGNEVTADNFPAKLAVADFDADGDIDLVATKDDPTAGQLWLTTLFNDGNWAFDVTFPFTTGEQPSLYGITAGDFDNDGIYDFAAANIDGGAFHVHTAFGSNTGGFTAGANLTVAFFYLADVVAADFDEDDNIDLAGGYEDSGAANACVDVYLGNGAGGFPTLAPGGTFGGVDFVESLSVADFDRDGHLDLAVVRGSTNEVGILWGDGDGTFDGAAAVELATDNNPMWVTSADFNNDGFPDVAAIPAAPPAGGNVINVFLYAGARAFGTSRNTTTPVGLVPRKIIAADFNGDGFADVAALEPLANNFYVFLGDGTGTFPDRDDYATTAAGPEAMAAGDFDGDGDIDIAVSVGNAVGVIELYRNNSSP